jgi:hypothetical protein
MGTLRRRLPKLDRVAFGIMQPGETPVGVGFRVHRHFNAGRLKLRHYGRQIPHPEIRGC